MSFDAYPTETEKVSATQINTNFVRKLEGGHDKEAADVGTAFIRMKMRQESCFRKIIPPVVIGPDDLDRTLDSDQPYKIIEKEIDSTATYVPFYGSGDLEVFTGSRYAIKFGKIVTKHWRKQKWELMSHQNDIRKILSDNGVKDLAEQEDAKSIATCDAILAAAPTQVIGAPAFGASAFKSLGQLHVNRKQPPGTLLMTEACYMEALSLPYTAIGDPASVQYKDGLDTSDEKKLWGRKCVTTIHNNIVTGHSGSTFSVYLFSPQGWLGNSFLLQDATLYVEQRADIVSFYAYEGIGTGIGNTSGISRLDIA